MQGLLGNYYLELEGQKLIILLHIDDEVYFAAAAVSPLVSGGGPLSDSSLCHLHGRDSAQPQLCGPQSCGRD